MRRIIPHPGLSVLLLLVWMLLQNSLSFGALVVGIAIGILVPIFTAPFWPGRPRIGYLHAFAYLALVIWDIVVANFEVAWIILCLLYTSPSPRD